MANKFKTKSICPAFDDALEYFGGAKAMALAIGVSAAHVRRFRTGEYKMRMEYAVRIEDKTGGKIKASLFNNILEEKENKEKKEDVKLNRLAED